MTESTLPAGRPLRWEDLPPRTGYANGALGALFFVIAEAIFFLGLVVIALSFRSQSASWPPAGTREIGLALLTANTGLLLLSSGTLRLAGRAVRGDGGVTRWLAATTALGVAFLAGQLIEFRRLGGWQPQEGIFRTLFDTTALLHGLHVAGGLALLLLVLTHARRGRLTVEAHLPLTVAELYWHFVTLAWLALFLVLFVL
jgi:cytochrome c oxidase subunit 3